MATVPRRNDVLFGKGTAINSHHGNKRYRTIAELQKPIFLQSKKFEKRDIAKNLILEIENMGGRFLMEDPDTKKKRKRETLKIEQPHPDGSGSDDDLVTDPLILAKVWVHVEKTKAIEKVMHRLREKRISVGQKHPAEGGGLELQPSATVAPKADTAKEVADGTQFDAKTSSHSQNDDEGKVAQNVARETNLDVNYMGKDSVPRRNSPILPSLELRAQQRIQSTLQPLAQQRIQSTLQPLAQQRIQSALQPQTHQTLSHNKQGISPDAPLPVSLKDWIRSTAEVSSVEDYLKSASSLAYMLTKRVIQIADSPTVSVEELSTEKVIVFLEPQQLIPMHHQQDPLKLSIKAVQFHFETQQCLPATPKHPSLQPHTFRMLLGNMLLEIFTMGRSSSPKGSNGKLSNHLDFASCLEHAKCPPQTRSGGVSTNDSSFERAKRLLVDSGMPLPICQLVSDLMGAMSEPCHGSAITSLDEVVWDLSQMMNNPQSFLFDRSCPMKAMVDTCLFNDIHLFGRDGDIMLGREREMAVMFKAKKKIADHVLVECHASSGDAPNGESAAFASETNLLCEAIFISGDAGSGKSSLIHSLAHVCNKDGWFVLRCKYDKQFVPTQVLALAFDDFFGIWAERTNLDLDPAIIQSFQQICDSIKFTIDEEGLNLLFPIIPNLRKALKTEEEETPRLSHVSFIDEASFAATRRMNLFHVLFKSLCTAGRPALLILDNLQPAKPLEGLKDLLDNYEKIPIANLRRNQVAAHGVLIVGAFRTTEMGEETKMTTTINSIKETENANVTELVIAELPQKVIGKLLSSKLCLPIRHTKELAQLVYSKSRGNPFFIVQFLKSIIENRMLEFSTSAKRWIWDCDVINLQMISNEVSELLTTRFNQLPPPLMETMKIASCFGSLVESSIMGLINLRNQGPFDLAINEGLMEKAGPVYRFTHDIIQKTIYKMIPPEQRNKLHRHIGTSLLQSANNNPDVHVLAVDQINISCKGAALSPEERSSIAEINVSAAKFSIAASSFEKARSYVDVGIELLESQRWEEQYKLCLQLHEMSASVNCMNGDICSMSGALNEIIAHVKSFEDSLTSSYLLARLLASSSKYKLAMSNCFAVLSHLGEKISPNVTRPIVQNELAVIQTTLANITVEQVKLLPKMKDKSKLNAMKFLNILCRYCAISRPMLLPLLSCRMVRLTIEYGFCDASIVGLSTAGCGLFAFTDDIRLGYRIAKVCDSLIEESPNRHALRSRLCRELCVMKSMVERQKSVLPLFIEGYNSAMLTGDRESAMSCLLAHCTACFYTGTNLVSLSKSFKLCIEQSAKYKQTNALHVAMANLRACIHLTGQSNDEVGLKSYEELKKIGEKANSHILLARISMSQMSNYFHDRNWIKVLEISDTTAAKVNHVLKSGCALYDGVASLALARQTHQPKWRKIGEEAVEKMIKYEAISSANYLWITKILQAELHYLNGNLDGAQAAYELSIASAAESEFINHQALGCELYGIFCIENEMVDKGVEQLQMSLEMYKEWGASRKVKDLQLFMSIVNPATEQESGTK